MGVDAGDFDGNETDDLFVTISRDKRERSQFHANYQRRGRSANIPIWGKNAVVS
jgi:hypothetical protein